MDASSSAPIPPLWARHLHPAPTSLTDEANVHPTPCSSAVSLGSGRCCSGSGDPCARGALGLPPRWLPWWLALCKMLRKTPTEPSLGNPRAALEKTLCVCSVLWHELYFFTQLPLGHTNCCCPRYTVLLHGPSGSAEMTSWRCKRPLPDPPLVHAFPPSFSLVLPCAPSILLLILTVSSPSLHPSPDLVSSCSLHPDPV